MTFMKITAIYLELVESFPSERASQIVAAMKIVGGLRSVARNSQSQRDLAWAQEKKRCGTISSS